MNEILGMQEPDAIKMDQPLRPEQTFEVLKSKISENIDRLEEALRSGEKRDETLAALGAEIVSYVNERKKLEEEIESLGHCPEGTSAGILLARSFFEAHKNIIVEHIAVLDGYLKVYEEAQKSGTFRGMFMGESPEDKAEPFFRGVTLGTYERWLEQNKHILNTDHSRDTIDLFQKKVSAYQKDIEALDVSIHTIQSKLLNPTIKAVRPVLGNNIVRLHLFQMGIQRYIDTYRDIVMRQQEEALAV